MGPEGAVEIVYRRELAEDPRNKKELIKEYRREFSSPYQAARLGYIDDVIEVREIRERIVKALDILSSKRVKIHPPKKHGNMPV
jgi:acetyl-CoA carboxylase carboxyltransferase component